MKREYAIDKLIEYADKCVNMLDLCHKIGIKNVGGEDYREIRNLASELGLTLKFSYKRDYSASFNPKKELKEILVKNSTYKNNARLKEKLFAEGLKEKKCERCGITEWCGDVISLQIHHINGIHNDNRLGNLQILCPNCHSQTDTYSGRNSNRENSTIYDAKKFEVLHPSKEELINDFKCLGSFVKVGNKYGVSDNSIRRWCEHYNIPTKKKELLSYINRDVGNG